MTPLYDLDKSLAELAPKSLGIYFFVSTEEIPEGLTPFATVREDEGITILVTEAEAKAYGFTGERPMKRVSLGAYTSLEAVGISATIAQTLASRSIPCNIIAGYHHDHLFIPADVADEAVRILRGLVKQAKGWLPAE